jgi:hypothetical protein
MGGYPSHETTDALLRDVPCGATFSAVDRVLCGCVVRETLGMVVNGWLELGHRGRMIGRPPIAGASSSRDAGLSCARLDSLGISGTGNNGEGSSHRFAVSHGHVAPACVSTTYETRSYP